MQMRVVKTMRVADRRDLLIAPDRLSAMDQDVAEMPVERIDRAHASAFAVGVSDNDHVPPALVAIACENNNAIANDVNRIAQIGIAAANSVPIFTHMPVRSIPARFVVTTRLPFPARKTEP